MNKSLARIIIGLVILAVGIAAFLDALNIINFWQHASVWWPISLLVGGLLLFLNDFKNFVWAIAMIVLGVLLQLRAFEVIDFNILSLIWPVIIVAIGISILINRSVSTKNIRVQDLDNVSAIFGGAETINKSSNYQGGKATAIFGGVSIDLRDAEIKKEATINVLALCGGVELKVPRHWKVQSQVFPILGGVESKAHSEDKSDKAPVLIITGTVALGGVEIRS
jgi:predicted membrane protein